MKRCVSIIFNKTQIGFREQIDKIIYYWQIKFEIGRIILKKL